MRGPFSASSASSANYGTLMADYASVWNAMESDKFSPPLIPPPSAARNIQKGLNELKNTEKVSASSSASQINASAPCFASLASLISAITEFHLQATSEQNE